MKVFFDGLRRWFGSPNPQSPVLEHAIAGQGNAFSLSAWPELPQTLRTAAVYRLLSVMSVKPVTYAWLAASSGVASAELQLLIVELRRQQVLLTAPGAPARTPSPAAVARPARDQIIW